VLVLRTEAVTAIPAAAPLSRMNCLRVTELRAMDLFAIDMSVPSTS
jgi:hypothetical protein